jgi:hypothetical protein|tara:strand:- start:8017 stop:9048 length:1032 start_codon:yes stop_codon:yes gene_type:complete
MSGENAPENTAEGVSDEGVDFGGGMGFDFEGLGNMINGGIETFHTETLDKQRQRGYDPCTFAASIEESWYVTMGPKWWKANSAARKTGMALNRAIGEAISARGVKKPAKYLTATPLWKFLIDQVGIEALLPEEVIASTNVLSVLAGPAAGQLAREQFVRDHLPTGNTIAKARVDERRRGLPLDDDIYLYGSGVAANPSGTMGSPERHRAILAGRYSGPGAVALFEQWIGEIAARVVPAGFTSARQRLEALVGSWQGSSEWGVWQESDGFVAGSQLGFFDEFRVRMWREFEEAQDKCDVLRANDERFRQSLVAAALETEKLKASRWWVAAAAVSLAAMVRSRGG